MRTKRICYKCGEPMGNMLGDSVRPKGSKTRYYHKECADMIVKEWKNIGKEKNKVL